MRELDGCDIGNVYYSKYCPTLIFDDVFVPWDRVFLCGETEFARIWLSNFPHFTDRVMVDVNPEKSIVWSGRRSP